MKYFSFLIVVFLCFGINAYSYENQDLYDAIESSNFDKIVNFFDDLESKSSREIREFLTHFCDYYSNKYGLEIFNNPEFSEMIEIYSKFLEFLPVHFGIDLTTSATIDFVFPLRCSFSEGDEDELPASLVIGSVEVFGGILAAMLPIPGSRALAILLIGDGINRSCNGLEDLDKENRDTSLSSEVLPKRSKNCSILV